MELVFLSFFLSWLIRLVQSNVLVDCITYDGPLGSGLRILDLWVNAVLIRMPKVVKSWTTSSEDYTLFRADPQKNNASTTFIFTI